MGSAASSRYSRGISVTRGSTLWRINPLKEIGLQSDFGDGLGSGARAFGLRPPAELLHVLMLPTSSEPTESESSGATRRVAPPPSC
jgi:hypothetical protein